MAQALALALCASGCFSDQGVVIEVDVGTITSATSVELYLGTSSCAGTDKSQIACAGIAPPPTSSPILRGDIWFRDALLPYTAAVKGHTATFQLRTDTPSMVPVAIAVGLSADGTGVGIATLNDLDVPAHSARVVTTTLTESGTVKPGDSTTATEDRVLVWKKANPPSSCVVVEHWKSGKADRTFVVPADDPDCDDVPAPECNPNAWMGSRPAGAALIPDCVSMDSIDSMPACLLGSHGCSETGTPTGDSCATQSNKTCVPGTLCGCNKALATCVQDALVDATTMTSIKCTVPMRMSTLDLCPGSQQISNPIDLDQAFAHYGANACEQPQIYALSSLDSNGSSADFHGAVMKIDELTAPCAFRIKWSDGNRTLNSGLTDYGAIKIPSDTGAVMIPIRFDFKLVPACLGVEQFACTYHDANDSLWACAR